MVSTFSILESRLDNMISWLTEHWEIWFKERFEEYCMLELTLSCCFFFLKSGTAVKRNPEFPSGRWNTTWSQRQAVLALISIDQWACQPSNIWVSHHRLFSASHASVDRKICSANPQNHKKWKCLFYQASSFRVILFLFFFSLNLKSLMAFYCLPYKV